MTATDKLRRLLDEREVEYDTDDEDGCEFTEWIANGLEWEADSRGELVYLTPAMLITPEQAIAATLGREKCLTGSMAVYTPEQAIARVWFTCGHDCIVETLSSLPNYCPVCGKKVVNE